MCHDPLDRWNFTCVIYSFDFMFLLLMFYIVITVYCCRNSAGWVVMIQWEEWAAWAVWEEWWGAWEAWEEWKDWEEWTSLYVMFSVDLLFCYCYICCNYNYLLVCTAEICWYGWWCNGWYWREWRWRYACTFSFLLISLCSMHMILGSI